MSARGKLKRISALTLLALLFMLICHYLISVGDPTQYAIKGQGYGILIEEGFYVDPQQQLSLEQVLQQADFFRVRKLESVPWSFDQQTYWIRLKVDNKNTYPETVVLHFSNAMLEQLTVYQATTYNQLKETPLGWQAEGLNYQTRAIPSYQLMMAANSSTDVYVRIATEGIAKTPINVYLNKDFSNLVQMMLLIWGSFVGILIVMSLFNIVLYAGLKDGVYLVYIGYIVSILMMLGVVIGFGHYIWPEAVIRVLRSNIVPVNISVVVFTLSFALLFFNTLKHPSRIVRICVRYVQFMIALGVVCLVLPEYIAAPLFFIGMAVLYPLVGIFLYQQIRINHKWARYYLVSWVPLIIGGAIQPMGLTGVIEESFLIHHALMIGVLFEIVLMAMALASRMQYKKERALYKATHDPGTRLPNSNLLEDKIHSLVDDDKNFYVCLIEVADFQTLQAYISNTESDDLMVMIARVIHQHIHLRSEFIVIGSARTGSSKLARINDGLFAAILTQEYDHEAFTERVSGTMREIEQQLSRGAQVGELFINLNTHVGVSAMGSHAQGSTHELLKQAKQALDQSRLLGKPTFYQAEQAQEVTQRLSLAASLQRTLRENKLQLYHQPQINLDTGHVDGSEALLRWRHEEYGFIPPDEFIPLAEDTGIVNELTLWVIDRACQHLEMLIDKGHLHHNVSVNISGKDIAEAGFLNNVREILGNYQLPLQNLTFELTESATVSDFALLNETLAELAAMGINIAIDDYGTGYSSLLYISQLPFTELKIDRSFVMDLHESKRNLTIVKTTIEMAKSLNLKIVAEGIENEQIESVLKAEGCHLAQGYHYQKPVEFSAYLDWLDSRF